jgi:hypothetical protein
MEGPNTAPDKIRGIMAYAIRPAAPVIVTATLPVWPVGMLPETELELELEPPKLSILEKDICVFEINVIIILPCYIYGTSC